MFRNKKAFTLTEMIIVIVIIGILMAGTTIYLQGSDETRKIIEAQGCATTIGGLINNYIFYSLTSKNLEDSDNNVISPDIYAIKLDDCNNSLCNSFKFFGYKYNEVSNEYDDEEYQIYKISDTCHTSQENIKLSRTGKDNSSEIKMNKGFSPTSLSNNNIFYIQNGDSISLTGEIIMNLCLDNNCETKKEVSERVVDGRTQTIYSRNCEFYNEDRTCKTREGCKVYDSDDSTLCKEY